MTSQSIFRIVFLAPLKIRENDEGFKMEYKGAGNRRFKDYSEILLDSN
jgi:hypothetical protein